MLVVVISLPERLDSCVHLKSLWLPGNLSPSFSPNSRTRACLKTGSRAHLEQSRCADGRYRSLAHLIVPKKPQEAPAGQVPVRLFGERPIFMGVPNHFCHPLPPAWPFAPLPLLRDENLFPQARTNLDCTPRCVSFTIFVNKPPQKWRKSGFPERFVKNSSRDGIPCTNENWSCRPSKQGFYVRCSSVQKNLFPSRIVGTLVSINPAFDFLQGEAYRKTGLKAGSLVHFGSVHGFSQIEGRPICRKCVQGGGKT